MCRQVARSLARLAFDTAGNDLFAGALRQWIASARIGAAPAGENVDLSSTDGRQGELTTFAADTLAAARRLAEVRALPGVGIVS